MQKIARKLVAVNESGRRVGETHQRSTISDKDVETILELRDAGLSYGAIARKFDDDLKVSKSTVRDICKGLTRAQIADRWKVATKPTSAD